MLNSKRESKNSSVKVGEKVQWKWLGRIIEGMVVEIYFEPITKLIKEKKIKRNGSAENPAVLVQSEAGNLALKLSSELSKVNSKPNSRSSQKKLTPKIFE